MNDGDGTTTGRPAEAPPGPGTEDVGAAKRQKRYLVRFESALRIMRRSEPDLTEEDAVWALWDAVNNKHVTANIPWSEIEDVTILAFHENGGGRAGVRPRDDKQAMRAASFDKEELERLYPPRRSELPAGREEAGSAPAGPELRPVPAGEMSGHRAEPREPEPRGARGPKPKDFWPKVLGYAAGWLAERGEAPHRQRELEDVILNRIEALGDRAARSTVRSYAREMLAGYRAQLDGE